MDSQDIINKKYLLINSCSKLKKKLYGVKAIELYDGPSFKIIRKYKSLNIDLFIVSAKYGLITENDIIDYYDEKMTFKKAKSMSIEIADRICDLIKDKKYEEILLNLGKNYKVAFDNALTRLKKSSPQTMITILEGPIGIRLRELKEWLISRRV